MADFNLSVIIPTYNRGRLLTRVLELLGHQSCPPDRFDVIVVDDGSSDNTENIMKQLQNKMPYRLDYIKQKKAGPASGRNRAIKKTRADIVLFIGDDTLPKKDLIERHLESHGRCPGSAVLGLVEWGRDQQISDFMRHISPNGFQFRYNTIKDDKDCGFRHFYTSNISIARKWFNEDMFDEDFPYASLEDTELAYRLEKKGLKIILNRRAVTYHYHPTTVESFRHRMKLAGVSSTVMVKKHPELVSIFLPVRNISCAKMISGILKKSAFIKRINRKLYWDFQIIASYIEGYMEGLEETGSTHRGSKNS